MAAPPWELHLNPEIREIRGGGDGSQELMVRGRGGAYIFQTLHPDGEGARCPLPPVDCAIRDVHRGQIGYHSLGRLHDVHGSHQDVQGALLSFPVERVMEGLGEPAFNRRATGRDIKMGKQTLEGVAGVI